MNQLVIAGAVALAIGCKGSSPATLPTVANGPSAASLAFLGELPASTAGFVVMDMGLSVPERIASLPSLTSWIPSAMITDFREMSVRRVGVDLLDVRSLAMVVPAGDAKPVFLLPVADAPKASANPGAGDLAMVQAGSQWVIGEPAAVQTFVRLRETSPRLLASGGAWARWAVSQSGGAFVVGAASIPAIAAAKGQGPVEVQDLETVVVTLSATGARAVIKARTGDGGAVESRVRGGLDVMRASLDAAIGEMPDPRLHRIAKLYADAFTGSVQVSRATDEIAVRLGWRSPELPEIGPAAPVMHRLAAKGEFALAQLNLGTPWLPAFISMSDVFDKPLNVAAVVDEVAALLPGGLTGQETAVTISIGEAMEPILSLIGPAATRAQGRTNLPFVAKPWGIAVGGSGVLDESTEPQGSLDRRLEGSSTAIMRGAFDMALAPAMIRPFAEAYVLRGYMEAAAGSLLLEIASPPGKASELQGLWKSLIDQVNAEKVAAYQTRKDAAPEAELFAIYDYHGTLAAMQLLKLEEPTPDTLRLKINVPFDEATMRASMGIAFVGVVAAVGVPAFMRYMQP